MQLYKIKKNIINYCSLFKDYNVKYIPLGWKNSLLNLNVGGLNG